MKHLVISSEPIAEGRTRVRMLKNAADTLGRTYAQHRVMDLSDELALEFLNRGIAEVVPTGDDITVRVLEHHGVTVVLPADCDAGFRAAAEAAGIIHLPDAKPKRR